MKIKINSYTYPLVSAELSYRVLGRSRSLLIMAYCQVKDDLIFELEWIKGPFIWLGRDKIKGQLIQELNANILDTQTISSEGEYRIKPHDLRLGNFVMLRSNQQPYKVVGLDFNFVELQTDHHTTTCSFDQIAGIPLTPDLVAKMGLQEYTDYDDRIEHIEFWHQYYDNGQPVKRCYAGSYTLHEYQNLCELLGFDKPEINFYDA